MATSTKLMTKHAGDNYADAVNRACDAYGVDDATRLELLHWFDTPVLDEMLASLATKANPLPTGAVTHELVLAFSADEPIATDEALAARYHRALDIINALVPLVPPTAFAWPPAQDALREAHAMLVEEGRQGADDEEAKRAAHTQEATREWLGKRGMR